MRTATEAANRVMSKARQNEVQTFKEGVEGARNEARTENKTSHRIQNDHSNWVKDTDEAEAVRLERNWMQGRYNLSST